MGVLLAVCSAMNANAAVLYGASGGNLPSNLYIIDPATAAATVVGAMPVALGGLAYNPVTGILYGVTTVQSPLCAKCLVTINPATAAVTIIGALNPSVGMGDITFRADGTLFGWNLTTNDLSTIDLTTATVTVVGDSGVSGGGNALEFAANGALYVVPGSDTNLYYTVNTTTGAVTPQGSLMPNAQVPPCGGAVGSDSVSAAATDPVSGVYYYARIGNCGPRPPSGYPSDLARVNLVTGAITQIGLLPPQIDALAFVPAGDVGVTKTGPATSFASQPIQYTITVTNHGPGAATNVTLTDNVPANTTFNFITQTSGPAFICSGTSTITCTAATMPDASSATFLLSVNTSASSPAGTVISNTASVAMTGDTNGANDTATTNTTLRAAAEIPALDPRMLAMLALAIAAAGLYVMRR